MSFTMDCAARSPAASWSSTTTTSATHTTPTRAAPTAAAGKPSGTRRTRPGSSSDARNGDDPPHDSRTLVHLVEQPVAEMAEAAPDDDRLDVGREHQDPHRGCDA